MKIGLRNWNFFGVKEFLWIFIFKMTVKINLRIIAKNHAADPQIEFLTKSISMSNDCATAMPIAWELKIEAWCHVMKQIYHYVKYQKIWIHYAGHKQLVIKPEDLRRPALFDMVPRVDPAEMMKKVNRPKFMLANVRNPFARVYSGWNDKFRNGWRQKAYPDNYYSVNFTLLRHLCNIIFMKCFSRQYGRLHQYTRHKKE